MDICPKCGLPLQACVCEEIAKTEQRIQVSTEKKKFGKVNTTVSGFQGVDLKTIAKELKQGLACGGTMKNTVLKVSDMSCGGCVNAVRSALTGVEGVQEADVSLEERTARVISNDTVSVDDLVAAVSAAGYSASIEA